MKGRFFGICFLLFKKKKQGATKPTYVSFATPPFLLWALAC